MILRNFYSLATRFSCWQPAGNKLEILDFDSSSSSDYSRHSKGKDDDNDEFNDVVDLLEGLR